jgi:hypothetical protein
MTQFRRYEHLERLNHPETRDIELGLVHVFPKLDGTNGSVWLDELGRIQCGSRNRVLTADADNQGFHAWVHSDDPRAVGLRSALPPGMVVYGEWLVPHTMKTYREEAWSRFWVFDVFSRELGRYLTWEDYSAWLSAAGVDLVHPLCTINKPSPAQLLAQCETNTYLVQDGAGVGEGVVIKRYDWTGVKGRQVWAKVVRNEFREKNALAFGVPEKDGAFQIERAIAEKFVTPTLVGKTRAKVVTDVANLNGIDLTQPNAQHDTECRHRGKVIPQLLGRVWHDLIVEEFWNVLRTWKNPAVDFGLLHRHVVATTKVLAADLFGGVPSLSPSQTEQPVTHDCTEERL